MASADAVSFCRRMSESLRLSDGGQRCMSPQRLYHSFTRMDTATRLRTMIDGTTKRGHRTRQVSDIVSPRKRLVLLNWPGEDS